MVKVKPGIKVITIGTAFEGCSIVATFRTAIVNTIEPSADALSVQKVQRLGIVFLFKQCAVLLFIKSSQRNILAYEGGC